MALRLTEEEVHAACAEIAAQGERPTALILLDKLGRGSLTTITKYLNSWNASDEAKVLGVESLPAIVELPPELTKDGEGLIKKIWAVAKGHCRRRARYSARGIEAGGNNHSSESRGSLQVFRGAGAKKRASGRYVGGA